MGLLKKLGKGLLSLAAGITFPLLGLIGIRRNYKVARHNYVLTGNMPCDQGWWDGLLKPRYGVTSQYVMFTTIGAVAVSVMGISEAAYGGNGGSTILITGLYSSISAAMVCLSPDIFRSWLNDVNRYFLCGRNKNWKDNFGNTRLHRAIYRHDTVEVRESLASGPDLTILNEKNEITKEPSTALVLANEFLTRDGDESFGAKVGVYNLVSDAVNKDLVDRFKKQTEEIICLLHAYSRKQLSRDAAIIVSDYCFDDRLPEQIGLLVNRNPQLQLAIQNSAVKSICFQIHQREQRESRNKNGSPVLAISVNVKEEGVSVGHHPEGYMRLAMEI